MRFPLTTTSVLVSNDGGFASPTTFLPAPSIPWTLDSSGPERLPKTVYLRFDGQAPNYTDDIILDQTPPVLEGASIIAGGPKTKAGEAEPKHAHRYVLRVKAKDNASGVKSMEITSKKRHQGKWRRFDSTPQFRSKSKKIFVRVRDGAHNKSHWRRAH